MGGTSRFVTAIQFTAFVFLILSRHPVPLSHGVFVDRSPHRGELGRRSSHLAAGTAGEGQLCFGSGQRCGINVEHTSSLRLWPC